MNPDINTTMLVESTIAVGVKEPGFSRKADMFGDGGGAEPYIVSTIRVGGFENCEERNLVVE